MTGNKNSTVVIRCHVQYSSILEISNQLNREVITLPHAFDVINTGPMLLNKCGSNDGDTTVFGKQSLLVRFHNKYIVL